LQVTLQSLHSPFTQVNPSAHGSSPPQPVPSANIVGKFGEIAKNIKPIPRYKSEANKYFSLKERISNIRSILISKKLIKVYFITFFIDGVFVF
jgi:hypothetical protein